MRSQLSSNDQWACPAPAPLGVVCVGCALGVLILFPFLSLNFVVSEFLLFWVFEPFPAPSGASHSSLLHLWGLTIVLPAPFGTAHLNALEGYCRDRCSLAVHRVLSVSQVKQGGKALLSGYVQLSR